MKILIILGFLLVAIYGHVIKDNFLFEALTGDAEDEEIGTPDDAASSEGSALQYANTDTNPTPATSGNSNVGSAGQAAPSQPPTAKASGANTPAPPQATQAPKPTAKTISTVSPPQNVPSSYAPYILQAQAQGSGCFATFASESQKAESVKQKNVAYNNLRGCLSSKCKFNKCNLKLKKCFGHSSTEQHKYKCWYKWFPCVSKKCSSNL